MSGTPVDRPLLRRREQRLLHRVLAGVELAVPAHEHAEDLRRELAQQIPDDSIRAHRQTSAPALNITARTSMARPSMPASGIIAASSSARSSFSTSIR